MFKLPAYGFSIAIINNGLGWADDFALAFIDYDSYGSAVEINKNSIVETRNGTRQTPGAIFWEEMSRIDITGDKITAKFKDGRTESISVHTWASQYLEFRNGNSSNCPQVLVYYEITGSQPDL